MNNQVVEFSKRQNEMANLANYNSSRLLSTDIISGKEFRRLRRNNKNFKNNKNV